MDGGLENRANRQWWINSCWRMCARMWREKAWMITKEKMDRQHSHTTQQPPFYDHYTALYCVSRSPPVKNWRILLVQSFTVRMPLLTATSAFGLGRRRWSSHQQCYLHRLTQRSDFRLIPADYQLAYSLPSPRFSGWSWVCQFFIDPFPAFVPEENLWV